VLWSGSAASYVSLHPGAGYTGSTARAVDGSTQAGGVFGSATGFQEHAVTWSGTPESMLDINPAGYFYSRINGAAGGKQVGYGNPGAGDVALLWSGTAASAVNLNPSGFSQSQANGVGGSQQVGFGSGTATSNKFHALLWTGTAASKVDLNPAGWVESVAYATNGSQQVGYGIQNVGGSAHALLWSGNSTAVDLTPAGFTTANAYGISGSFQVGNAVHPTLTGNQYHAMLWNSTAASYIDLHALLPAGVYVRSDALGIAPNGDVIGSAVTPGGQAHAILWTVPEPGSGALVSIVLVAAMTRRRRGRNGASRITD
jgi:hypothetical protein